jgi:bifunctional UDP-N-acetylglucosamine pyrophosphorylase/glucosamine-1-phosphate N-acetyltransferase
MKAIILAAGIGKRMQPIQKDKCLLKFLGKAGIKEFIIICNPRSMEKIKDLVRSKAEYVLQDEAKGMANALLSIKNPPNEALIVGVSDLLEQTAYEKVLNKKEGDAVILGYKVKGYFSGGYLITESERVKGIIEKPGAGNEPSDLVNIVVHLHRKFDKLIEYMKSTESEKDDVYERSTSRMMKDGYDFRYVPYDGEWVPIKYPWHMLDAMRFFFENIEGRISANAEISSNATIDEKVIIEDGVKIFENAVIAGPCYIGKNSVIGTNCLVRQSIVSENCVIGFGSEIARSYIGENTMIHTSYVGDSIIMGNCNLGAGTITGNWRFDKQPVKVNIDGEKISTGMEKFGCIMGENCKTGINSSIMPGKKLGPNSIVGSAVCLQDDLESGKIISIDKKSYVIKENTKID